MPSVIPTTPNDDDTMDVNLAAAELLTSKIKGQTLHLPNMRELFPGWTKAVNPLLDELTAWFEEEMEKLFPDAKVRAKIRKSDFPSFVCLTFPTSPLPRLQTITYFALWSCLWDDEMESSNTQTLCHRELEYVRHLLGFSYVHPSKRSSVVVPQPPTKPSRLFAEPARVLRETWSEQQLKRFMGEMELYIGACAVEERYTGSGSGSGQKGGGMIILPGVEEYTGNRLGSSSGGAYFALAEFMIDVEIPQEIHDLEEMRIIWSELCRSVSWINDLISLKKEINSSLYSLIPIAMNETGGDLHTVVSEVLQELETCRERFESAAGDLLFRIMKEDAKVRNDVERFIESCTIMVTGYTEWSLQSDRYGVKEYMQEDGSFLIPL
ncbi:isoprenoid synthase domain-containing protein [Sordaria brevicollis]|uniref:Terpene synthase n=1 Tax=Sordaria brevicollis TaxID=83679 RepID=A0AAE0U352_SORBR|nr:isoprenoid synthase domain-containing protein [Sordaria brevicollis]